MTYLRGIAAAVGALLVLVPAGAANATSMPSVDQLWSGAYIGVAAGAGSVSSKVVDVADYNLLGNEVIKYDGTGGIVGGTAGFNWQSNSWVYGVEGDLSWSGIDETGASAYGNGDDTFLSTDVNWLATLRARFGRAFADHRLVVYVTAGVVIAGVKNSVLDVYTLAGTDTANLSKSSTRTGFIGGAGLEFALHNGWSVKGEYLCADLGDESVTGYSDVYHDWIDYRFDDRLHLFRVGLNYRH